MPFPRQLPVTDSVITLDVADDTALEELELELELLEGVELLDELELLGGVELLDELELLLDDSEELELLLNATDELDVVCVELGVFDEAVEPPPPPPQAEMAVARQNGSRCWIVIFIGAPEGFHFYLVVKYTIRCCDLYTTCSAQSVRIY